MSVPSNPTRTNLITEGIAQAGESNPSSSLLTRAGGEWMEEIKNDIWHLAKKIKSLHVTAYTIINQGQSRYAYPSDYSSDLYLTLLSGSAQGTAQSGGTNYVVLESSFRGGTEIIGKEILMMSGTSVGSYAQIVSYNTSTKQAGVIPNFSTAPVSGDTYMIIDVEYPVETRPIFSWERDVKFVSPGLPQYAYPVGDDTEGYFIFNTPPNTTYGARLRYYADLTQLDVESDLMSSLYRRWRNIFIQGIKAKKLNDEDDDRAEVEEQEYQSKLRDLIYRESYGMDISNITDRVTDYL